MYANGVLVYLSDIQQNTFYGIVLAVKILYKLENCP